MDGIPNSCTLRLATLHRNVPVILALLVCGACAQTYLMIDDWGNVACESTEAAR